VFDDDALASQLRTVKGDSVTRDAPTRSRKVAAAIRSRYDVAEDEGELALD
jgi:hypothetical protein